MSVSARVLGARALGRATLVRQLLVQRTDLPVVAAVERLLGLNAQDPNLPYLALWSRLEPFAIRDLTGAIENGSLVRSTLMRATQHLVSVPDFRLIRPLLAPLLQRVQRNAFGRRTAGVDLEVYADESGRELFDLPDAPRPPADLPAPVRFLPEFDAPLLAYADRTRMMTDEIRRQVCVGAGVASTVLVDGTVAATWMRARTDDAAVLMVRPFRPLARADRDAVGAEGDRLLAFTDPDAARRSVRIS